MLLRSTKAYICGSILYSHFFHLPPHPKDEDDDKSVVVEIRATAGGDEAALFANELFL
jgi:hypothetical protein